MIRFACPNCDATYSTTDDKAGKVSKCQRCGTSFTIPEPYVPPPPPPPPPPPRPLSPNDPIEIQPCPKCQSRLSVLAGDLGSEIECPTCRATYTAVRADAPLPPGGVAAPPSSKLVKLGSGRDDEDDEDDDDDRRRRKKRRRDDEYEEPPPPPKRRRSGRPTGTVTVARLGVLSAGKMMGAMYALIGLIAAMIQGVFLLLGLGAAAQFGGNTNAAVGLLSWSVCLLVLTPVIWGVAGFIGGVIGAALYNLLASMLGGIEMDLE